MNKTDLKEKIIFLAVTIGIFLPVRVFFYTYVSDHWLGSFGIISAVMGLLLYLVKKDRLGYIGRIWKKQIIKISQGKLGIAVIIKSIFFIIIFSGIVYITDYNQGTQQVQIMKNDLENKGISGLEDFTINDFFDTFTIEGMYIVFQGINEKPELIGQMYAVIDDFTYGYHQHFNIVWLVEEIEFLGFVIYFRYFAIKKMEMKT